MAAMRMLVVAALLLVATASLGSASGGRSSPVAGAVAATVQLNSIVRAAGASTPSIALQAAAGASLVLSEAAASTPVTMTVALGAQPSGQVVLSLYSSKSSVAAIQPKAVTFTPSDWSVPQAASLTTTDNAIADGTVGFAITAAVLAASSAPEYAAAAAAKSVMLFGHRLDDETPGLLQSADALALDAHKPSAGYTLALDTAPSRAVTLDLVAVDAATAGARAGAEQPSSQLLVSPRQLTFGPGNWSTPVQVTASLAPGASTEAATGRIVHSVSRTVGGYTKAVSSSVTVTTSAKPNVAAAIAAVGGGVAVITLGIVAWLWHARAW